MVEGARLEIVYTPKGYREFESHPLRQRQHCGDVTKIYQSARVGRQQRYVLTRVRHHNAVSFFFARPCYNPTITRMGRPGSKMFELCGEAKLEVEIKKSRFIATCLRVGCIEDVQTALARLKCTDATHNCWAYRIGELYRFNDDGEPGGSAGRPMLAAIDGQMFDNVLAHVVRYFGGIKLGVGGLVRAYGNTVAECLRTANKVEIVPYETIRFEVGFADTYGVYGLMTEHQLTKISEDYTADGVQFALSVEAAKVGEIRTLLNNITRARVRFLNLVG